MLVNVLIARESTLEAVFKLMRSKDVQTQTHTGKTACNLVHAVPRLPPYQLAPCSSSKNMCTISAEGIRSTALGPNTLCVAKRSTGMRL